MFNKYSLSFLAVIYLFYIFIIYGNLMPEHNIEIIYYLTLIIGVTSLYFAATVLVYKEYNNFDRFFYFGIHLLNFYLSYRVYTDVKNKKNIKDIKDEFKIPLILTLWIGLALVGKRELFNRLLVNTSSKKT